MKPVVAAGAVLLAFAVLAVAFDPAWCVGVARRAVYGPPPEPVSASITVTADGAVSIDGEELREPVATKTQVTDAAQTVSGVLRLFNQEMGTSTDLPTKYAMVDAGGSCQLRIEDITLDGWTGPDPQPVTPPGARTVAVSIAVSGGFMANTEAHEFVYFEEGGEPWEISRAYSVTVTGQRLNRAEATSYGPGRDGKPVYAREVSEADTWEPIYPMSWSVQFGSLSVAGQQVWNEGMGIWEPNLLFPVNGASYSWLQHEGWSGYGYSDVTVVWSACDVSFDGMGKTVGPMRFQGSGNTITASCVSDFTGFGGTVGNLVAVGRPYLKDFSAFAVVDRAGDLVPDLLIDGGFVADPRYPWTANCPPVPSS